MPQVQASQFSRGHIYDVGHYPYQIIAADFNNDGNIDLAVADAISSQVSILLGKGDGTFEKAYAFSALTPVALAAGVLTSSGNQDLAVVQFNGTLDGSIAVFLGDGHGKFRKSGTYTTGVQPMSVALADFNGDGHLDAAVADSGTGDVRVFFGDGTGKFGKPSAYKVPDAWAVAAGNLSGDHVPDLAVSQASEGGVAVFLNSGSGKFSNAVYYEQGIGVSSGVVIADFNHDGSADLAVVDSQTSVVDVLLNKGNGTFKKGAQYPTWFDGGDSAGYAAVVADFNLDGNPDLAVVNQSGDSALFYGKGDGAFKKAVRIDDKLRIDDGGLTLAVGDFNNDGAPDLAFAILDDDKVVIMLNTQ